MSKILKKTTITVGKNDPTADFNTADFVTDWDAIVSAYNFASQSNNMAKNVFVKSGIYNATNGATRGARLRPISGINLIGENKENTIIFGTRTNDWLIINRNLSNVAYPVKNVTISNFTFDLNNLSAGSGIRLDSTEDCLIENCNFKNGAINSWFIAWGAINSVSPLDRGVHNKQKDCNFDTHQGSLEMVLVYNQDSWTDLHSTYKNKGTTTTGPILGLWQNCNNSLIESPIFIDNDGFNYYSITCENTRFNNVFAKNTGCVLQGANVSDNSEFGPKGGLNFANNLVVDGFTAIGGVNSSTTSAIQLGAVRDYNLKIDYIDNYEIGIQFFRGNHQNYMHPYKGSIQLGTIKNCNPNNNAHAIHPALYFAKAGDYDLTVIGGEIYDDRPTAFQTHPVSFEDPHIEPNISFTVVGGVITSATIVNGGSNLPRARNIDFPLPLNVTGGTGAVITAYTNNSGVITQINIVNGGTGYTTPILSPIATYLYQNIRFLGTKLIPYNNISSITKLTRPILEDSVEFYDIRNAVKGGLASYYDKNINDYISNINDANFTNRGFMSTTNQSFNGRKEFASNNTWFGLGIVTASSVYSNIGNLGTNTTNYWRAESSTVANINQRIEPKGTGRVETQNGGLEELRLNLSTSTISALSTTTANLYTVPTGRTLIITKAFIRPTTVIGTVTTAPAISIGGNSATFDDFLATTTLTNTTTTGRIFTYQPNLSSVATYSSGQVITAQIDTAQIGATALTYTIDLFGYLL